MKKLSGYMAGVNLGGWISLYSSPDIEHFKNFITERDIKTIASWGMDHVRIPVDYSLLEDDANPGVFLESGFAWLDNGIGWAKKYGLNAVLDLHRAPGYSYNTPDRNILFSDKAMQDRLTALWKAVARRYRGEGDNIIYELLNEIVEPDSSRWNPLAEKLIAAIREEDREHRILVGGILYNNVQALALLPLFADEKVIYNFHFYEPVALTHQKAQWIPYTKEFNRPLSYPSSDIQSYLDFLELWPLKSREMYRGLDEIGREFICRQLKPALEFIEKTGRPLYCGEYGVIDNADMASREAWCADVSDILLEYGIGRAVWTYKSKNFTLVDEQGEPVSEKLIRAVSKR